MFDVKFFITLLLVTSNIIKADDCNLSQEEIDEIRSYQDVVNQIIEATTNGQFKSKTFEELAVFVDKFGARLSGTQALEDSIDYLLDRMNSTFDIENVHGEEVQVPHWERILESAEMVEPITANIRLMALGGSVSTPAEGIEAPVVVVKSSEDIHTTYPDAVEGKIVVINYEYVSYGVSVNHRYDAPNMAARHGALAVLVRSVTDFSMSSPHTGQTRYDDGVTKIPVAAITVEDANMLERRQERGENVTIRLNIQTQTLPDATSRNTVGEIVGSEKPEKVVIVSGHLDSWDVGVGALDDGGGAFISWYSLVVLKSLGLRPKRTVRSVLWTAEENGMAGVYAYDALHKDDLKNFIFVMESDDGTFTPLGLRFVAGTKGACILTEIMKLLEPINATQAVKSTSVGSDITIWRNVLPTGSLYNQNDKYFWYHHTKADTMEALDPDALDRATALWTSVAYVLADLKEDFPNELTGGASYASVNVACVVVLSMIGMLLY